MAGSPNSDSRRPVHPETARALTELITAQRNQPAETRDPSLQREWRQVLSQDVQSHLSHQPQDLMQVLDFISSALQDQSPEAMAILNSYTNPKWGLPMFRITPQESRRRIPKKKK